MMDWARKVDGGDQGGDKAGDVDVPLFDAGRHAMLKSPPLLV
jgi:hypothetical protein